MALSSGLRMLSPVVFPPGFARLATSPLAGISSARPTMGIEVVAACAVRVAESPNATIEVGLYATSATGVRHAPVVDEASEPDGV